MEDIYQTNSLSFKNKKDGLINFRTVSYVLGILVLVEPDYLRSALVYQLFIMKVAISVLFGQY